MEIAAVLAREVLVMFLLIAVGVVCKKTGILTIEAARSISNVLLMVVVPCLILRSFQTDQIGDCMPGFWMTAVLCIVFHVFSIVIATFVFPDKNDGSTRPLVERVAAVFSNCGFMGFPLLLATVGDVGILYGAMFVGIFNIASWVWSAPLFSGAKELSFKQLAKTPVVIAFFIGLVMFLFGIPMPSMLAGAVSHIAGINTPVSMLVIGVFLSSINIRETVRDPKVYLVVLFRNLVFPLLTLAILWAIRVTAWLPGGKTFAIAFMIMVSCASATTAILMAARYNCDSSHGAKIVAASTFFSIVTLPLVLFLTDWIF